MERTINQFMNQEALNYALYTVQKRAIPHLIDGLKPVHRFFIYSALKNNDFKKVAAISGRVSEYGYHHGEDSASEAGMLMAAEWANNVPLIKGRGNFGSRLVQKGASPRYTSAKIHDNFYNLYKDLEIAPKHSDPEHIPPTYYVPVIPTVLLNGIQGIATGFATNIPPHSIQSVLRCTKDVIEGKEDPTKPQVSYPQFTGTITPDSDGRDIMEGVYELEGKTKLTIKEVPYHFDRIKYIEVLDKLEEEKTIVRYTEGKGFNFSITLRRDFKTTHENIVKTFKLRKPIKNFITLLTPDGIKSYDNATQVVKDFVEYRKPFLNNRIQKQISNTKHKINWYKVRYEFVKLAKAGEFNFNVSKAKLKKQIESTIKGSKSFLDKLATIPIYSMSEDELKRLEQSIIDESKVLDYWKSTTSEDEFRKDIEEICTKYQLKKR